VLSESGSVTGEIASGIGESESLNGVADSMTGEARSVAAKYCAGAVTVGPVSGQCGSALNKLASMLTEIDSVEILLSGS